jgi:AP-1 complex subunit gamma-1
MLGYSTHFGHMEALKLIATSKFSEKRIGYLALMLLLDEKQEVLMLVTSSLQADLKEANHFVVALALCAVANVSSPQIASDVAPDVEKLLKNQNPYVRKKACLAAVRILRKVPHLVENFIDAMPPMLNDRNHAVLLTATTCITEICSQEEFVDYFRSETVSTLVRILRNLVHSGYTPEHDVSGLTDPFLQVAVLRLLRVLGTRDAEASDKMADILAQVVTNTEITKNAGNAIVYECISTIMAVESESGLRTLAVNVLGRFLLNRDNNIRYVALSTLGTVVIDDSQSVQRHRGTIVECLKDADISIRHRAQHLVYSLVNQDNVRILVRELVDYLSEAETSMKGDLAQKICNCVDEFAPNKRYHIDTVIKVLLLAGNEVKDETTSQLITLINTNPEIYGYAVQKLYVAAQESLTLQVLGQITMWCIGEYGEMLVSGEGAGDEETPVPVSENDTLDLLEKYLRLNTSTTTTKEYAVTALVKLSARFSSQERLLQLLAVFERSVSLELQQRTCEYAQLVRQTSIRSAVLERMPAVDMAKVRRAQAVASGEYDGDEVAPPTGGGDGGGRGAPPVVGGHVDDPDMLGGGGGVAAPAPADPTGDLLGDLLGGSGPAASMPQSMPAAAEPVGDLLGDLLGGTPGRLALSPVVPSPAVLSRRLSTPPRCARATCRLT